MEFATPPSLSTNVFVSINELATVNAAMPKPSVARRFFMPIATHVGIRRMAYPLCSGADHMWESNRLHGGAGVVCPYADEPPSGLALET
jgi:hypothetical protein